MRLQNDFEKFYSEISHLDSEISDKEHSFAKGNNIYFHATASRNANGIVKNGFKVDKANHKTQYVYFGKSFFICAGYLKNIEKSYSVFAIDLNDFIKSNEKSKLIKVDKENGTILSLLDVDPQYIIGQLDFYT